MKHQTTSATFLGDVRVLVIGVQSHSQHMAA